MNTFVKGENEMWKMSAKKRFQTRIVSASSGAEGAGLSASTFSLPRHSLEVVQAKKKNTHSLLRSNHPYYRNGQNISGEKLRLLIQKCFHIWINIGYTCERTTSVMPRVKSHARVRLTDCNLQSQLHCAVTPFRAEFRKIDQLPTASGVLLMVSRII